MGVLRYWVRLFRDLRQPLMQERRKAWSLSGFPLSCAFPSTFARNQKAGKSATTANLRPCCLCFEINSRRYPKDTTFTSGKVTNRERNAILAVGKKESPPLRAAFEVGY